MARVITFLTVAALYLLCSCESELERKARMTAELEMKSRQEALDAIEEVKSFAATKNPNDPAQVILVIEKLRSEDMQGMMTAVESDVREEYRRLLHAWNNHYIAICRTQWRAAKKAANEALRIQDYDKAISALDNYPQILRTYAHEYWDDLQRYKDAITNLREAPGKAFEAIADAEAAVQRGDYPAAIEICLRAIRLLVESKDTAAVRVVTNEHISIIDRWVNDIANKEGNAAALEKLAELCGTVASTDHNFYLLEKTRELGGE